MKNAEVEKICHWSALVGQLGRSKNSRGHLKLILCCSLPDIIPHIKFHLNRMKNTEVPIFEFWDPHNFLKTEKGRKKGKRKEGKNARRLKIRKERKEFKA